MKELYRAIPNDEISELIEVDITEMTPMERYDALSQLKEPTTSGDYIIKYHLCDHGEPAGGCQEEDVE